MEAETHDRVIVVKIGSQVLCTPDGQLDGDIIANLAGQVSGLARKGHKVLVVSSGAVAAGSSHNREATERLNDPVVRKQVLAATGQVLLMERWGSEFSNHGLSVAKVLTSKSDFQSRRHYLNMRGCLEGLISAGIIPVVNENDVVATTELMFTDNDELAGLLAGMVDADLLVMLSSIPGIYSADDEIINRWDSGSHRAEVIVRRGTSRLGRGGMHSKLNTALETASLGTRVVIADGREPDILALVTGGEAVGTCFPPGDAVSPAKRWLASAEGHANASVIINQGAAEALLDNSRLTSLLPVGIMSLEGEFDRGDVLLIRNEAGGVLGCGKAQYTRAEAQAVLGKQKQRPLIHYDFLYLPGPGTASDD